MSALNRRRVTFVGVSGLSLAVAGVIAPGAFAADTIDGNVKVSNTETVQVLMSANGSIDAKRIYDQLVLTGDGKVDISNPVSEKGLRNLDGFGGFDVRDGKARINTSVDGTKKFRSVSTFTGTLPLKFDITYTLDGKKIKPADVVGKSGELEVRYVVTNTTGKTQDVPFLNGNGVEQSSTEDVVIPMVGSLTTVLPSNFTKVSSAEANAAGDGRGGTQMSFTMTLIPPIGSATAEFGYTAQVKDAVIPKASVSALPVNPLESPSFKGGAASYAGGAQTGQDLTAGATEIDANVLKLRDGASDLVSGIIQLRDGANKLSAGLTNDAAPGAKKLADGASKLDAGAKKLSGGTDDLSAGATKLKNGASDLSDGTGKLSAGATKLNKGAGDLSDGLSKAKSSSPRLAEGLAQIEGGLALLDSNLSKLVTDAADPAIAGLGSATKPASTVSYGIAAVRSGLADAKATLDDGLAGADASVQKLTCASLVVKDIAGGANAPGACFPGGARPPITKDTDPIRTAVLSSVGNGLADGASDLDSLTEKLNTLSDGLGDAVSTLYTVACGVDSSAASVCDSARPGVLQALLGIKAGVGQPSDGPKDSLRGGVAALKGGSKDARVGALELVAGLGQLSTGANQLKAGTGDLSKGAGDLDAGAGKLAAGTGDLKSGADQLNAGAGTLEDGTGQLSAGAGTLADGLGTAAAGSGELAAGLEKAADSAPALPEGAERLSAEGTTKLIAAGDATASDFGLRYALIEAGAARAASAQPYGSPEGATALTAFKFEIAGEDGAASANMKRGMAAIIVLAGAGVLATVRRRGII